MIPLIGLTTYGRDEAGSYTLPSEYVSAVRRAGGLPVLIPPGETNVAQVIDRVDAVILAGGGDIDPVTYGGNHHPAIYMVDGDRDRTEIDLARRLVQRDMPTLAICRGAQILNVALGGTLHEHIPDRFGQQVRHRLPPREPTPHAVEVEPKSRLAGILGQTSAAPMSWHHQGMNELAGGLEIVSRAPDGVVEAVELPEHRWLVAVQWHPELTAAVDPGQQRLFDALVAVAIETQRSGR
jgi:putative glutamine amidotransferase